jgi:hypothetical protein
VAADVVIFILRLLASGRRQNACKRSFATWAALGWFCKPGRANPSKGVKENYEDALR